ncbi:DctP family TRAP transporter solute-binding subunit [Bacillus gobiensis]|uniref:DctP family TRAP transporter solute-binding subunit n=1 Tax=Bacillus gobiensis TaxID=1441095 RepID=UPI003D23E248
MRDKKVFLVAISFSLLTILSACGSLGLAKSENSTAKGYTLRLTHVVSESHASHRALVQLQKGLEEKTDGRLKLEIYPGGQLYGSDREAVEAVQLGNIEMTVVATPTISTFNKKFMVFDLPFSFQSIEEARKAVDGKLGKKLNEDLLSNGLVSLGYAENGFRQIANNTKPIETPDDLKSLKLRVIENKLYQETFNELGANASPLSFSETYSALQQGTFDGMDNPVTLIYSSKFYEVQKYLTLTHQVYAPLITVINKDFFDQLPNDLKQILKEETSKANQVQRSFTQEQEEKNLAELKEIGMKINQLTPEQEAVFKKELEPVIKKYEKLIGSETMHLLQQQ